VPAEHRAGIVGNLLSADDRFESALWELYLHAVTTGSSDRVEIHPDLPGTSRHPDFLVHGETPVLPGSDCSRPSAGTRRCRQATARPRGGPRPSPHRRGHLDVRLPPGGAKAASCRQAARPARPMDRLAGHGRAGIASRCLRSPGISSDLLLRERRLGQPESHCCAVGQAPSMALIAAAYRSRSSGIRRTS
jgi:hypothetical protein